MDKVDAFDFKTFEHLVGLTQNEMRVVMTKYLRTKYKKVVSTKRYIYAVGDIPIALVAHMDTVFKSLPTEIFYDERKNVVWGDDGLGADDRAGIYAILKIIEDGFRPCIILTTDEEVGGIGASALSKIKCPFPNLKYMIELDRQGADDCVFYQQYNPAFVEYIEDFGFIEQWGTYSDICELAPAWNICAVNLSIGYIDEHTRSERLYVSYMLNTINKVENMLNEKDIPNFEYAEMTYTQMFRSIYGSYNDDSSLSYIRCNHCKTLYSEYEVIPAKGLDGNTKYFCPDCIVGNVEWCEVCEEPYESDKVGSCACPECRRMLGEEYKNV